MKILNKLKLIFGCYFPNTAKRSAFKKYDNLRYGDKLPSGWHEYELLLLPEILDSDSVFFDVGSNLGIYVYKSSQYCFAENIHAFEPLREYNKFLSKVFPNVRLQKMALSNQKGSFPISVPVYEQVGNYSRASLSAYGDGVEQSYKELYQVETNTLDNYVLEHGVERIDLIKIDVEGHERDVLEGARNTLLKYLPILIVEIEARYVEDPSAIVDSVKSLGYECLYINSENLELNVLEGSIEDVQVEAEHGSDKYVNNFIFINSEKVGSITQHLMKVE